MRPLEDVLAAGRLLAAHDALHDGTKFRRELEEWEAKLVPLDKPGAIIPGAGPVCLYLQEVRRLLGRSEPGPNKPKPEGFTKALQDIADWLEREQKFDLAMCVGMAAEERTRLRATARRLMEACEALVEQVGSYRKAHDFHGDNHIETWHAWDRMFLAKELMENTLAAARTELAREKS